MEKLKATIQCIITNIASSIHSFAISSFIFNLFGLSYKLQLSQPKVAAKQKKTKNTYKSNALRL